MNPIELAGLADGAEPLRRDGRQHAVIATSAPASPSRSRGAVAPPERTSVMSLDELAEDDARIRAASGRPPVEAVMDLALAYLPSRALHVAANLGIADLLADGPRAVQELAAEVQVHALSLERLLRTLAMHGVFAETEDGRYTLTPPAALLRTGALQAAVKFAGDLTGDGSWWSTVGCLGDAVATGTPSFEHVHGARFFEYIADKPQLARWFGDGMANISAAENPAIAAAYDFAGFGHVVDVGGGRGGFLAEILRRAPDARGTLFDPPDAAAHPAGLTNIDTSRWRAVSGDFFASVPAGADAYVLKRVIHDWDDDDSLRLLRTCRAALRDDARLLVIDAVLPPGSQPHPAKVLDLLMMASTTGRERTQAELTDVLERAGLRITRIVPTPTTLSIIEATPIR